MEGAAGRKRASRDASRLTPSAPVQDMYDGKPEGRASAWLDCLVRLTGRITIKCVRKMWSIQSMGRQVGGKLKDGWRRRGQVSPGKLFTYLKVKRPLMGNPATPRGTWSCRIIAGETSVIKKLNDLYIEVGACRACCLPVAGWCTVPSRFPRALLWILNMPHWLKMIEYI